jgi:hypothetical protein
MIKTFAITFACMVSEVSMAQAQTSSGRLFFTADLPPFG